MEYWNNGIKKQKDQFHSSGTHFQPIIPVFQHSRICRISLISYEINYRFLIKLGFGETGFFKERWPAMVSTALPSMRI